MENASKALLMAATMLIAIMIISLGVYLFASFGNIAREKSEDNKQQQITQFNAQFTSYQGKECTIYDVVTLANLATENNKYYDYEKRNYDANGTDSYITIKLNTRREIKRIELGANEDNQNILESNNNLIKADVGNISSGKEELKKYKIDEIKISEQTNKVYFVSFIEI